VIQLLLDQGLPRSTVHHLQDQDIDMSRASDTEIIEYAATKVD
jgi:hypothetical protein